MLLVSLYEFTQFLQIVLWIAVPATILAIGLTVFLHYRRKKKQTSLGLAFQDGKGWDEHVVPNPAAAVLVHSTVHEQPEAMPDWLASANPDNTPLLKKYEHEVRRYRENYALLEQDFRELEGKYTDLRNKAYHTDKAEDTSLVVQLQQEIRSYREKISHLQQAALQEAPGDEGALTALQQDLRQQQAENNRLQQLLVNNQAAGDDNKPVDERLQALQQLLEQADADRQVLREKLEEQEYLPDVLDEKKTEISFLQQQLEQRIKNYHTLEHQANASVTQISQLRHTVSGLEQRQQLLQAELDTKQQQGSAWHTALEESRQETGHQQQLVEAGNARIAQLEQELGGLRHTQQALQEEIAGQQTLVGSLQEEVVRERQKAEDLGNRLDLSSQLLMRIYSELSRSIDPHQLELTERPGPSPVGAPAEALLG